MKRWAELEVALAKYISDHASEPELLAGWMVGRYRLLVDEILRLRADNENLWMLLEVYTMMKEDDG
jgi:hypothetical protein